MAKKLYLVSFVAASTSNTGYGSPTPPAQYVAAESMAAVEKALVDGPAIQSIQVQTAKVVEA